MQRNKRTNVAHYALGDTTWVIVFILSEKKRSRNFAASFLSPCSFVLVCSLSLRHYHCTTKRLDVKINRMHSAQTQTHTKYNLLPSMPASQPAFSRLTAFFVEKSQFYITEHKCLNLGVCILFFFFHRRRRRIL